VSIFFSGVLPRHTLSAALLWQVLRAMLGGMSIHAAAQGLALTLEAFYGACRRVRRRLDALRAALCQRQQPPPSKQPLPLLQTFEHLQSVFKQSNCPLEDYQLLFQQPLMG
jgi:hypothetical protein